MLDSSGNYGFSRCFALLVALPISISVSQAAGLPFGAAVNKPTPVTTIRSMPRTITTPRIEIVGDEEIPTVEGEVFVPRTITTDRVEMIGSAELPVPREGGGWVPLSISTPRIEMIGSH